METLNSNIENETTPKDISSEFSSMDTEDFFVFLRSQRNEPALSITIDWVDVWAARRLKAFVDEYTETQKRSATIRATKEQFNEDVNAFASGVKWEQVS